MAAEVQRARHSFTRKAYHCIGEAGILEPTERVEHIRGEINQKSPVGARPVAFVNTLPSPSSWWRSRSIASQGPGGTEKRGA